ncbi:GAF and ANTAR domain-containing protein [Pseudonocardia sp. DSM 110487]|uniref:GAF and ANTAR domain-containing protein n=1 Tax=Pseudonocardia sp. DSM 110487 TaxID=2865833 RepID=UPI001C6A3A5B|nr:GAF and ANTAR domain-containing protein [Pseudonocardia sp. DSM 110487]QYN39378.1 GAF and ANTAR domain-containing protein [Pseudonocardia sp. DSM 110487]
MSRPPVERERSVSHAFVVLADTMVAEYDAIDLLDRLIGFCVELLPADAAGIVLGDARRELRVVAASSEAAELMELLQLQSDEGPCLDCFQTVAPVSIADLAGAADRWPRFAAAVAERGQFRAVHALPLRLRGQAIGALNLFDREPGSLPDSDLALGQALADVATIGILQERAIRRAEVVNEQLQTALTSRVTIEQAKGVLSQHFGDDVEVAFDRLRHYARSRNAKLAHIAAQVVRRELDPTAFNLLPGSPGRR